MNDSTKLLKEATERIRQSGSETPQLDAELLMSYVVGASREEILAHLDEEPVLPAQREFNKLVRKRARGWSVAAIVGQKEFYGLDFFVNKKVLIPRPFFENQKKAQDH